jgi:iron complex outermembrane receptor protein
VETRATAVVTGKPQPQPSQIAGTARNAKTGAAIAKATVNCGNGHPSTTASDGRYTISNLKPSSYTCTASAAGYRPSTQTVTLSDGQTATANFSLVRQ